MTAAEKKTRTAAQKTRKKSADEEKLIRDCVNEMGRQAVLRLFEMAESPETQEKSRIDIYKWFAEMACGRPGAARVSTSREDADDSANVLTVRFEGEMEGWAG